MSNKIPKKKDRLGIDRYGRTDLHNAVLGNDLKLAIKLINNGIDVNAPDDDSNTALHFATQNYNFDMVKLLVENGAKVNIKNSSGNNPLSNAVFNCKNNNGDIITYLRNAGADPFSKNNYGISPIDLANEIANYDIKKYFVDLNK